MKNFNNNITFEKYYVFCKKLIPIIDDLQYAYKLCNEKYLRFNLRNVRNRSIFINIFYDLFDKKNKHYKNYDSRLFFNETGCMMKYSYFLNIMLNGNFNCLENILNSEKNLEKEIKNIHDNFRNKYIIDLIFKLKLV